MALWRVGATIVIFIALVIVIQGAAGPAFAGIDENLSPLTSDRDYLDGPAAISGMIESWFQTALLGMFGIMLWGLARVIRREGLLGRGRDGFQ